jgi:DNA-directed RNA polymerase subunit M/transcription elongation factor TFIIS
MPVVATYTKMEDAHLAVSKLQGSGVEAWLRDEATANLYWLYSNAIGGVKVEVRDEDFERALEVLDLPKESSELLKCPHCGSENVSIRQMNLWAALALIFLSLILPNREHTVDCMECGKSFRRRRQ